MRERLIDAARREGLEGWTFNPEFDQARAAYEAGIKPSEWEQMSVDDRGEILQVYRSKLTMKLWEEYITRPKQNWSTRAGRSRH